jgi:hypothetical protein
VQLTIVEEPGTSPWAITDTDARRIVVALIGDQPVRIEYWPRRRAQEVWRRDRGADDQKRVGELRGYSFATPVRGHVAVIFVDYRETYETAMFVALHEIVHLLVREDDDDELHADLIAAVMMTKIGYPEGIREAGPHLGVLRRWMLGRR